jgi:hypothetical protein
MASTPLYKSLKSNGTSFYAFPGAAEDISAAYQNTNYKMYFSKFALLNFPVQNTSMGTQSNPIRFNFDSLIKSGNANPTTNFTDGFIESLRNYVANHEVVMRESRKNDSTYYYDTNEMSTPTEKIFWKWCKKIGIIDFDPAVPDDEFISGLNEFQSNSVNDITYFPEYLWKEREVINWDTVYFYASSVSGFDGLLEIEFNGKTNFRIGDTVVIYNVTSTTIAAGSLSNVSTQEGMQFLVKSVIEPSGTTGERVIFNVDVSGHLGNTPLLENDGQAELVYHRLIQYIGEISGISNVQEANRNYTEVYAHVPDHVGMTPNVLFRTEWDTNYRPNLRFPILPSQIQPEIMGAENFSSPIVSSPQNYPGSYFGQFDTIDFTYESASGDILRRSGEYYGISGDTNAPVLNTSKLDGLKIDFDTTHYSKMNIPGNTVTMFEQFNGIMINNNPPSDFEFNAVLWYYTVEDNNGVSKDNIYGITILDNPSNNLMTGETGKRFPTYTKLVANGNQDGTSYAFNLSLNFNVMNENVQDTYNPESINSLFSMDKFNLAMQKLSSTNDSFLKILAEHNSMKSEINDIKGLLYTQSDLNSINARLNNLDTLLRLYSTMQIVGSDTISVSTLPGSPPSLVISNIDPSYYSVETILTTDLYNIQGIIPRSIPVPVNKTSLINVINNDETDISMPNDTPLNLVISRDLFLRQTMEFNITATETSTQNKRLNIFINTQGNSNSASQILLAGNIDLPYFYNSEISDQNSAYKWNKSNFDIDFNQDIILRTGPELELSISGNTHIAYNSIKTGDLFYIDNLYVGTNSVVDISGQYPVSSKVGPTSSVYRFDMSSNPGAKNFASTNSASLPMFLHGSTFSNMSNMPSIRINKGLNIRITKTDDTSAIISERYRVVITNL